MLRDKIEATVKWRDAFSLKIKFVQLARVNISKHFEYEASCLLPVLLLRIYTFILNIY